MSLVLVECPSHLETDRHCALAPVERGNRIWTGLVRPCPQHHYSGTAHRCDDMNRCIAPLRAIKHLDACFALHDVHACRDFFQSPVRRFDRQLRRNQLNWYFKHRRNTMLRVGNNTTGHTGAKETKRPALSSSAPITSPQLFNSGARPTLRCLRHMHPVRCSNHCTFLIATRAILVGGNVTTIPFGVGSKSDHT